VATTFPELKDQFRKPWREASPAPWKQAPRQNVQCHITNRIAYFMVNLQLADESFDRGIIPEFTAVSME
jgi:hypothetical protein